ncbi:hypothetical protein Plhal304r1_c012g0046941 [Plasmopara halstedii]
MRTERTTHNANIAARLHQPGISVTFKYQCVAGFRKSMRFGFVVIDHSIIGDRRRHVFSEQINHSCRLNILDVTSLCASDISTITVLFEAIMYYHLCFAFFRKCDDLPHLSRILVAMSSEMIAAS